MKTKEPIEIPLGAKDSELKGWEYTIPEGMEAEIKDGKIIVREKESEDERIRKELLTYLEHEYLVDKTIKCSEYNKYVAWLEKQGSQILANSAKTCKDEQNTAWSEEDEDNLYHINALIEDSSLEVRKQECLSGWLKSLKERYTWKPSDEQMRCLLNAEGGLRADSRIAMAQGLSSLYNDLKKLKG